MADEPEKIPAPPLVVIALTIPDGVDISIIINGEQFLVEQEDD
jgi:hypothetical protein